MSARAPRLVYLTSSKNVEHHPPKDMETETLTLWSQMQLRFLNARCTKGPQRPSLYKLYHKYVSCTCGFIET